MAPGKKSASKQNGATAGPPLFFNLLYSDNQTAMFNIDCQKEHLVSAIRRRCKIEREVDLELCTTRGEMLKLSDRCDQDCLTDVIRNRDELVLCKLEASRFAGIGPRLIPLLKNVEDSYPALKQLVDSIDKQVSDSESKIASKLQPAAKKASPSSVSPPQRRGSQQSQLQDAALFEGGGTGGMAKGRQAIKRIMLINKMTKK